MNRNLIFKIIILIAVLIGAQGIFWFFKTTAVKKQVLSMINSSEGAITASKVLVSGFPLKQRVIIEDVKLQSDDEAEKLHLPNKYQINIKNITLESGLYSSNFNAIITGPISMQDSTGSVGYVEFKQEPKINFTIEDNRLKTLSYQDNGYKIVDEAKNTLYDSGDSKVDYESVAEEGDKVRSKIKASFNDIQGMDIFSTEKLPFLINSGTQPISNDPAIAVEAVPAQPANSGAAPAAPAETVAAATVDPAAPVAPTTAAVITGDIANTDKKSIYLEVEYVMGKKSADAAIADKDALPTPDTQDAALELQSVDIKELQFSDPNYKINVTGGFTSNSTTGDLVDTCDLTVKIEKIDNILTYIKKLLPANTAPATDPSLAAAPAVGAPGDAKAATVTAKDSASTANPTAPIATTPGATDSTIVAAPIAPQPPVDFATAIVDLAKKNTNTTETFSIFEIRKEKDGKVMINETPISEVGNILSPALTGNTANENY